MLGWFRAAIERASRAKRSENCSCETLMATSRPTRVIVRAVDLAHAAGADESDDLVRAEALAGR